ncbi:MAG: gliding motility lipoprotein GldD [Flavobacteriales bacterium TMED191]|nr:MAG: gliding motility lipoprotein GldD [Flavobacteriales bacterium TMED191]|tara:strand:- start:754 stop:1338 length:585 start_codon:yes stop_codon:yes gene_type:complete
MRYILIIIILLSSCKERFSPKPKGYMRIDLENKIDSLFQPLSCPFKFTAPNYFSVEYKMQTCWIDLTYPKHRATIHLTYKPIDNNLFQLIEDSRQIVYKHTVKADAIKEKVYNNFNHKTFGTLYDIHGQTASAVQFHITDSNQHFLRGSLYFHASPNQDSLSTISQSIREDILKIIETLKWEDEADEEALKTDK